MPCTVAKLMDCAQPLVCGSAQHASKTACAAFLRQRSADASKPRKWWLPQRRQTSLPASEAGSLALPRGGGQASSAARRCEAAQAANADSLSSWEEPPILSDEEVLSSCDETRSAVTGSATSQRGSSSSSSSRNDSNIGGSMSRDRWRVPLPPHLHGKAPRRHWNANALAFLGDSVWEVRRLGGLD